MLVGKSILLPNVRCKGKKRKKEAAAHEGIAFTQPHNILTLSCSPERKRESFYYAGIHRCKYV